MQGAATSPWHFIVADTPKTHPQGRIQSTVQQYAKPARRHVMRRIWNEKRAKATDKSATRRYANLSLPVKLQKSALTPITVIRMNDNPLSSDRGWDVNFREEKDGGSSVPPDSILKSLSGSCAEQYGFTGVVYTQTWKVLQYISDPQWTAIHWFRTTWFPLLWSNDHAVLLQVVSSACSQIVSQLCRAL
jgi:hypothetical protein